jgi:hypothetical protein
MPSWISAFFSSAANIFFLLAILAFYWEVWLANRLWVRQSYESNTKSTAKASMSSQSIGTGFEFIVFDSWIDEAGRS